MTNTKKFNAKIYIKAILETTFNIHDYHLIQTIYYWGVFEDKTIQSDNGNDTIIKDFDIWVQNLVKEQFKHLIK